MSARAVCRGTASRIAASALLVLAACGGEYALGALPHDAGVGTVAGDASARVGSDVGTDRGGGDPTSSQSSCAGKSCGDPCGACAAGESGCADGGSDPARPDVFMVCDTSGVCGTTPPVCDGASGGGGAASSYAPCAGRRCGDACSCGPNTAGCSQSGRCNAIGACTSGSPGC